MLRLSRISIIALIILLPFVSYAQDINKITKKSESKILFGVGKAKQSPETKSLTYSKMFKDFEKSKLWPKKSIIKNHKDIFKINQSRQTRMDDIKYMEKLVGVIAVIAAVGSIY